MGDLKERLDHIFQAQRCGGPKDGLPEVTPYWVVGIYLDDADLEAIRPHLSPPEPELPDLGDVGRYNRVPVFHRDSAAAQERPPQGFYRGIGFRYVPMGHVFM